MEEYLKTLIDDCTSMQSVYEALSDETKDAYTKRYNACQELLKACQNSLKTQDKRQAKLDLEETRTKHHYWENVFQSELFLAPNQNASTIQTAYTQLSLLEQKMTQLDWDLLEVSSNALDLRYHKAVKAWQEDCRLWLEEHAQQALVDAKALVMAQNFLAFYNKRLKAIAEQQLVL